MRTITAETLACTRRLDGRGVTVLLLATIGTNLIDFATVPPPGTRAGAPFLVAAVIRVAAIFWASYALQRQLLGTALPYAITGAFWRFALLQMALLVVVGLATQLAKIAAGPAPSLATFWLASFVALGAIGLLLIRVLAWNAALSAGEPFAALPPLWRAQAGWSGALAYGYLVLVLPIAALHLALTLVAVRGLVSGPARLGLALVDGGVQAWQLLATLALSAVALERAQGRSVEAGAVRR